MDNADNETGFRIERCQGQGCNQFTEIASTGAGVVTFSDSGLGINNGHDLAHDHENEYSYRIRAYNAAGNSAASNIAQTTTPR